jgi:cytochrome c-type protein NapC
MSDQSNEKKGLISRLWQAFKSPSKTYSLGLLLILGFTVGVVFLGGFNYTMAVTNTEEFCISCHEMETFVFSEYKQTSHFSNRTGVSATCPDCHVPKDFAHKVVRKIEATRELWHMMMGTIDTPEKYEAKRLELAQRVWTKMEETDSRACRNCHQADHMNMEKQQEESALVHTDALEEGMTCIDCHKGIAHELPEGYEG